MKKLYIILIILFSFCLPLNVKAAYDARINGSSVKIRTGAGTNNSAIATVSTNTQITVKDKTLIKGEGCDNGWYSITYKEKDAYVCSTYVKFIDTSFTGINIIDWIARVNSNNVSVRKTPSTSGTLLDTLTLGANVNPLEEVAGKTSECSTGIWYKIQYYGDKVGYICSKYVTKKVDVTETNEEYTSTLKSVGFPDSYIPYLTYLHTKYPNWEFKADINNENFSVAVDTEEGINYMQTTNDNYRTSTKPVEGKTWYRVNKGVIAFYMDPRNWLTEDRIFMFEKVDEYNESLEEQYINLVKKVFGSGKLSDDKYAIPIVNASKTLKASPLMIASRINLEVGSNGSASTSGGSFTWKGKTYSGYYNFFNIGAYEVTINGVKYSAVQRGLAYAAMLDGIRTSGSKWNTIEIAIKEGIDFLVGGYIFKGQNTLYFQKFNTASVIKNKYTHQYMTNIQAPAVEGNSTYNSYKAYDVLNSNITFVIPVYNNLPLYTSLPNSGNDNNNLKSLSINGYNIIPNFDEDITTYEIYVPTSLNTVNVEATPATNLSTVTGNGEITLDTDDTDVTITVKSQTGLEKSYVLTIHRIDDTRTIQDVTTASSITIKDNYLTRIKNNTNVNTIQNTLVKNGARNVIITSPTGVQVNGTSLIGTGYKITINTLIESKTYTIVVNGDTSGDGKVSILDLLQVQKHIKGATKLTNANLLAADTSNDGKVSILDLLQVQKHLKGAASL